MGFLRNLFDTIAESAGFGFADKDFIPKNNKGEIIQIKHDASWMGLENKEMQLYAYQYCAPLATVIDRQAEADVNGTPELFKIGTEDVDNSGFSKRIRTLFDKPNALQTYDQFRMQQDVYKLIFGWCPVLAIGSRKIDSSFTTSMWNLPPWLVKIEGTGKMFNQRKISDIIKEYSIDILGETVTIPPDAIILLQSGNFQDQKNNFLTPLSKLVGLDFAVSNFCAAMEADNVLLKKKGPLGFITHDSAAVKDPVSGYLPMTPKEKSEVQDDLQQYGLTLAQFQYVVTRQALKWVPMGYDTKQLGTKETVRQAERTICQRYNYSYVLLSDEGSTYANQEGAHKALYQNNIIPNNEADMAEYGRFFKCQENNVFIKCKFDHLPVLQADVLKMQEAAFKQTQALDLDYKNGLITLNQYRVLRGYPEEVGGDTYYELSEKTNNDGKENDGSTDNDNGEDDQSGSSSTES